MTAVQTPTPTIDSPGSDGQIEAVAPAAEGIRNVCPRLRERVLGYLDRVYSPGEDFPFHEHPGSGEGSDLETATMALMCLQHLRCEKRIERLRSEAWGASGLVSAIDRYYDPRTRTYWDANDSLEPEVSGAWRLHNDATTRRACAILGVEARPGPERVEHMDVFPWADPFRRDPDGWIDQLFERNARSGAKETFQYMTLYSRATGLDHYEWFDPHLTQVVERLESKRDSETGLIGMDDSQRPGWAMRGYRNMCHNFFWPMGVPQAGRERVIDTTLACRNADGSFDDGSMCANMDAVEVLAEYALQTGYRLEQCVEAIRRCINFIFQYLALPCGGFRYKPWDCPEPEREGYGEAKITAGTAFVLLTLRYWQAVDPEARGDISTALKQVSR